MQPSQTKAPRVSTFSRHDYHNTKSQRNAMLYIRRTPTRNAFCTLGHSLENLKCTSCGRRGAARHDTWCRRRAAPPPPRRPSTAQRHDPFAEYAMIRSRWIFLWFVVVGDGDAEFWFNLLNRFILKQTKIHLCPYVIGMLLVVQLFLHRSVCHAAWRYRWRGRVNFDLLIQFPKNSFIT